MPFCNVFFSEPRAINEHPMGEHFHQEMRPFLVQDSRVPQLRNSVTQLTHCQLRHELVSNVLTSFLEKSLEGKAEIGSYIRMWFDTKK